MTQTVLEGVEVQQLAASLPPDRYSPAAMGLALIAVGGAMAARMLPPLDGITAERLAEDDVVLVAHPRQTGDLPAVAAWAAAYERPVTDDVAEDTPFRHHYSTTVPVGDGLALRVWTARLGAPHLLRGGLFG